MHEKPSSLSCYLIADIKVFPDLNVIEVQGDTHRVEPKVMLLLNYLSEHQGEVCSKQNLIDAIWPNQIIADEALTRLIFVLRNLLSDDAKAPKFIATVPKKGYVLLQPITLPQKKNRKIWLLTTILLALIILLGLWVALFQPETEYKIVKSTPVTFQEGREYDFAKAANLSAYFHQQQDKTKVMVAEQDQTYRVLESDNWQKRSLQVNKNTLFYIRFNDNENQIIRQSLNAEPEILFSSPRPIYHLSIDRQQKGLMFTYYKDNANTELFRFSFIDEQVTPVKFNVSPVPNVIKQHFYNEVDELLVFVGIQSRLPVIYGYQDGHTDYQFEVKGFDSINDIAIGKYNNTLLVAGSYRQIRGIWSVNTLSNEPTLLFNANDDVITGVHYSPENHSVFYSLENHRQDITAFDWQGNQVELPQLNSTLTEGRAQFSRDNRFIYFASDRNGYHELYRYNVSSYDVEQITRLQAKSVWYYRFSKSGDKLAIVYSTDHIQLGIIDVKTGNVLRSIELDEIKFPLAWSQDDKSIYVSEHRSAIAMYLYDSKTLSVKQKQQHLGLSAVEIDDEEIIAFDYTRNQFVRYSFNNKMSKPISKVLSKPAQLAPPRVYVDRDQAFIIESNDTVHHLMQLAFSEISGEWGIKKQGLFEVNGRIQAVNPEQQKLLFLKGNNSLNGSIIELKLLP